MIRREYGRQYRLVEKGLPKVGKIILIILELGGSQESDEPKVHDTCSASETEMCMGELN